MNDIEENFEPISLNDNSEKQVLSLLIFNTFFNFTYLTPPPFSIHFIVEDHDTDDGVFAVELLKMVFEGIAKFPTSVGSKVTK